MAISPKNITDSCTIPRECKERFLPLEESYAEPLTSRGVNFSGISDVVQPYEIIRSTPGFHVVIFTLAGEGEDLSGGIQSPHPLQPGDLWISPAGTPQHYRARDNWRILFFHLDAAHASGTIPYDKPTLGHSTYALQLESAMTWFIKESLMNTATSRKTSRAYAEIIRHCLDREIESLAHPEQGLVRAQLDGLWETINGNISNNWSVEEMARRMGLSSAQFRRIVSSQYGLTPQEILTRLRIGRTKELLRRTDYSLEQIADQVGYDSPFSLSRAFKRNSGLSPRDFRKCSYSATTGR
ncbi:MAG: AraC family transcriptional regulator [Verrucomicrobiae bacterium]|nr:AraC family transcriptional regulator [Verrucomicrobiae bacterium]